MPHPFPGRKKSGGLDFGMKCLCARAHDRRRTDDDIRIPVREARIDQDTTDFFLLAARGRRRGRGQVDIHVIGPLELHARTPFSAQHALVAACAGDGQPSEVLYKDEAGRGEPRSALQWRADENGEL